jgi:hypothetical protein
VPDQTLTMLCERAAQRIAESLPASWTKAWLHIEPLDGLALIYCWYQPARNARARYYDLPPQVLDELTMIFRAVRRASATAETSWSDATLCLDAEQGTFSLDFSSDEPGAPVPAGLDREIAWQQRYLAAS